ncbi:hypothetical protein B5F39_08475 [Cloacibacillus sp. An23]|nr:hypothetical protein B5F39_08475 [Cloacibacillus sp. An23]
MRDMSRGSVAGNILAFAFPLMLANIFQQLYGVANSVVVGRQMGAAALAATGTAIPIVNVMVFLLLGVTMGSSVLMAEFFGAGDERSLKDELSTSAAAGAVFTLALSAAGVLFTEPLLAVIRTPSELAPMASAYLRIIFLGLIFTFFYNLLSFAMRAVGESAAPLVFLIISSLLNVALSVLFVRDFGLGVEGAAAASVLSQAVSALLSFFYIKLRLPVLVPESWTKISAPLLRRTLWFSSVSGVQQTVLYFGILVLQGAVNPLGITSIAAFNAVSRIDGFVMSLSDSFASSLMMFASQNRGAGERARVFLGLRRTLGLCAAVTSLCAVLLLLFPRALASAFLGPGEDEALARAVSFLRTMALFYLLSVPCNTFQGFFRGVGRMKVVLYATYIQIPVRVAVSYALARSAGINAVAAGISAGWVCMASYQLFEYRRFVKYERGGKPTEGMRLENENGRTCAG